MPHFMIVLIPYINSLNLSWIIKCLFLRNMEPLRILILYFENWASCLHCQSHNYFNVYSRELVKQQYGFVHNSGIVFFFSYLSIKYLLEGCLSIGHYVLWQRTGENDPRIIIKYFSLTLVMLNKLRCHAHPNFQPIRLLDPGC